MSVANAPAATVATWFCRIAIAEALSWTGLLIGMFFKWIVKSTEIGVSIFGPIHGAIFVVYVVACFAAWRAFGWRPQILLLALGASIPPLFTYFFERWATRNGHLEPSSQAAPTSVS